MRRASRLVLSIVLLTVAGAFTAPAAGASPDVYRYHGLKEAKGADASDGIYQDFSRTNENVGKTWADPDATLHRGTGHSSVLAYIDRDSDTPHLTIEFDRQGYGANLGVIPLGLVPEKLPKKAEITFEMRSESAACVGVRMMERDGEIWGFGPKPLEYTRLCVVPGADWRRFRVPLSAGDTRWFQFVHAGNHELGNDQFEADLLASLGFELGLAGKAYFSPGRAKLDLRDIRVVSSGRR